MHITCATDYLYIIKVNYNSVGDFLNEVRVCKILNLRFTNTGPYPLKL